MYVTFMGLIQFAYNITQTAAHVDKAVRGAGLNLNPQIVDSNLVKVIFPKYAINYTLKIIHYRSE
jgi:ribosome recycling factor